MEGTNIFVLFIVGFVLGCVLVMLLWMASPGCLLIPGITGGEGTQAGTSANLTPASGTYTNSILRDSGGRTLAPLGDRGAVSIFTDENGKTRNVLCYMSYYCVDETPCEEEECVQLSQKCGEWPSGTGTLVAATNQGGTTDYGDCCPPYECLSGYCSQEECVKEGRTCVYDNDCCEGQCINGICGQEECQQQNDLCGNVYPQQTATTAYTNQQPTYYGECCDPFQCLDNRCTPQEGCVETGKTCGTTYPVGATANYPIDNGDCCPPDECVANVCTPADQCVETGKICGRVQDPSITTAVVYKDYGECCAPDECVNNVCGAQEEPCQETEALCGYGPPGAATYTTNLPANRTWHGDCCTGDTCVDGYCQPECAEMGGKCSGTLACCDGYCVSGVCATCTPEGYTCKADSECCGGYACSDNKKCEPLTACMKENAECGKDSDCCNGLVCFDGTCKPEGVCGEAGQTCGLGVECCGGMECSDNDVCVECAPVGETCGGQYTVGAGGLGCCSTGYCYSGTCQQKAKYMCSDTENGPNYYTAGSATGVYQGDYGTYTDYCLTTASSVVDYYCEVDGEYSEIQTAQVMCTSGCSGGACI